MLAFAPLALAALLASRSGRHSAAAVFSWLAAVAPTVLVGVGLFQLASRPLANQPYPDAHEYADAARHLAAGRGYVTTVHEYDPQHPQPGELPPRYPPGFPLALAPFAWFGTYPENVQLGAKCWAIGYVVTAVAVAAVIGGPLAGGLTAVFIGTSPFAEIMAIMVMSDALAAMLALLVVPLVRRTTPLRAALAGLLLGGSVLVRLTGVTGIVSAMASVTGRRNRVLIGVGAVPGIAALGAYQWWTFGSPLLTGYSYWVRGIQALSPAYLRHHLMSEGPFVVPDAVDGVLMRWATPHPEALGGPQNALPNWAFYPALLLGGFWVFAPPFLSALGLAHLVRHRRDADARYALATILSLGGLHLFYFHQATRFMAAPATLLVIYAAVTLAPRRR